VRANTAPREQHVMNSMRMNCIVYLIGTNHKYQHNSPLYEEVSVEAINEFKNYISKICFDNGIEAIGEEFHQTDLKKGRERSVSKEIALNLNICHKYCSPSDDEAQMLGWKPTLYQKRGESIADFDRRDWENDKIKEQGWVQKILDFNKWPLLFICGSKHINSFTKLLYNFSIKAHVVNENWEHNCR
jgi:hypothetical protein